MLLGARSAGCSGSCAAVPFLIIDATLSDLAHPVVRRLPVSNLVVTRRSTSSLAVGSWPRRSMVSRTSRRSPKVNRSWKLHPSWTTQGQFTRTSRSTTSALPSASNPAPNERRIGRARRDHRWPNRRRMSMSAAWPPATRSSDAATSSCSRHRVARKST